MNINATAQNVRFGNQNQPKTVREMTDAEFSAHIQQLEMNDRAQRGGGDPRYQTVSAGTQQLVENLKKQRAGQDTRY